MTNMSLTIGSRFKGTGDGDVLTDDGEVDDQATVLRDYLSSNLDQKAPTAISVVNRLLKKPNISALQGSIRAILSSDRGDDVISGELAEIVGFDDIDLVMDILKDRFVVLQEVHNQCTYGDATDAHLHQLERSTNESSHHHLSQQEARRRMEQTFRENAARPLFSGTAKSRFSPINLNAQQEAPEVLPHVYSSSVMSQGNVLSQLGSKYMLPMGTVRKQEDEFEEVIVPPAKTIPPKAGERLLPVNDLEPLARESFPGYESLNRIQSLVYPTAYGTNENLLICAPTGAVNLRICAPMKALASEIVRKLSKRLSWLSIQVRELTGDMQMTKAEIAQTQIIVTTPEKWDVVTRKPTGEGELAASLKLLIIDEVHLLNEERGAVIETIVARTLRQVLLAFILTLVGVSKYKGLFYFDSSFRPVPLEQHFIGIKGKAGSAQSKKNLDSVTFLKVSELVAQGHQVMVFVHARKETVKSALALKEAAFADGTIDNFGCEDHPQYAMFRRSVGESRNKEMKQLFDHGFGIHHAGMLRSDRNMMERMFEARAIKGTQVYDSSKGSFVDLSVLDVLQVFGRAGRPGLESSGEGYICTTEDKLTHYLDAVTSQSHSIPRETISDDPQLGNKRHQLINFAAQKLADVGMIAFERATGAFTITDLGRIAAKYYIRHASIEIFNKEFRQKMTEADALGMLSMSTEVRSPSIYDNVYSASVQFEQIQFRESEATELELLMERIPCDVKGGMDNSRGKVNILLQAAISREVVDDFALVSDMAYALQNGGRIVRALLEIAISRKWANVTAVLMGLSKAIEKRMWPFDQPLKQFDLKADIFYGLQQWADEWSPSQLASLDAIELGKLVHLNERHGQALLAAANQFPAATITYDLRPIGPDILKICTRVKRAFTWNSKVHGNAEPFWLWIEDSGGIFILQLAHLVFRQTTDVLNVDFIISVPNGIPPPSITIRYVSDRWMGAEEEIFIPLESLVMPTASLSNTPLLDLPFLPTSTLIRNSSIAGTVAGRVDHLNAIQSQSYWSIINTKCNALLCAPVGSGKSSLAHILACITASQSDGWVIIVTPRRSLALETMLTLRNASSHLGFSVEYAAGPSILDRPKRRVIHVVTTAHLLRELSKRDPTIPVLGLDLVICENVELLDPTYELAVALLRHATQSLQTRFVGFSSSLNDASDMAEWLDVSASGLHSFRPQDRDQSLVFSISTFTIPQSGALFKAMAKPAHAAIQMAPSSEPTIIFIPSRGQCKPIALDLLTQCALQMETERGYLSPNTSPEYMEYHLSRLQDTSLIDFVSKGVGFFHEGILKSDRNLMLELFAEGHVRVLLVPRDSCWTLPIRATVVIVMGTQYFHVEAESSDRQLRDYPLTELVRMQSRAIKHNGTGYFHLFCQAEAKDTITRFLNEGLPIESQLLETDDFAQWVALRRSLPGGLRAQDVLDVLSFTFLGRRVVTNPAYYDCTSTSRDENLSRITDKITTRASELASSSMS
ncbi:hypothetical protein H0H93_008376 [Arthromyces matolae]|nr:hypothetical protein H0H93_008376 [Arthromyces matolae]